MSDYLSGEAGEITSEMLTGLRQAYKNLDLDTQVHTHGKTDNPNDYFFSPEDLKQFKNDFAAGITKQILLSNGRMTRLDLSGVDDDKVANVLQSVADAGYDLTKINSVLKGTGATYTSKLFDDLTAQGFVKMLGIKGVESKYTEAETRESARKGVVEEDAKEAADILQESTGRAVKKIVERTGLELETFIEKTDTKGNKTWSSQINNKFKKLMEANRRDIDSHNLDEQFGVGTKAAIALNDYREKYQQLMTLSEQFNNSTSEAEKTGLQQQINNLLPVFNKAQKELIELIARKEQFLRVGESLGVVNQDSMDRYTLEHMATANFFGDGLIAGQNIATAGTQATKNGRQLLVDVLDRGTISRYGIEVDELTGQVRQLTLAEGDLVNAFQNVNKAMRQNEGVQASLGGYDIENESQLQQFLANAHSPALDAYNADLKEMQEYTANLWNVMKEGGQASQQELDYLMVLSERVISLGKNVQKTSVDFKNLWAQNPDRVTALNINTRHNDGTTVDNRDKIVRDQMDALARSQAWANNQQYDFVSFDNDKLKYTLTDVYGNIQKVTMEWNELYQKAVVTNDATVASLDPVVAKIEKYKQTIDDAKSLGYLLDGDDQAFIDAEQDIAKLIKKVQEGTASFEELEAARKKAIDVGGNISKTINKNKRLYTGTNEINSVNRQRDKIIGTFGTEKFDNSNIDLVQQYKTKYQELIDKYDEFAKKRTLHDKNNQEQLRQQAVGVQGLGRKLMSSITQADKLRQLVDDSGSYTDSKGNEHNLGGTMGDLTSGEIQNLETTMRNYVQNTLGQANIEHVKFNNTTKQLTYTFRTSKDSVADMVVQYNAAENALFAYNKQERESLTGFRAFMQQIASKTRSILQYTTSITSIYRVFGELKRGIQYVKEIDSALTELKKVTDETEESYDKFLQTAAKTADKVGSTIQEVVSSTADWARLGYSLEDAHQLAESTSVLLNVSEFQSIEDATSALTSTLQAFGYTAEESMNVVDVLNEVGNNFAISSDGIATALQDSASSLMAANNSYEEAVALIAAANRVVILRHGL